MRPDREPDENLTFRFPIRKEPESGLGFLPLFCGSSSAGIGVGSGSSDPGQEVKLDVCFWARSIPAGVAVPCGQLTAT